MSKAIDLAEATGVRTLQLAGDDVYYQPSTADSLARFHQGLAWATAQASAAQVMLAVEIMDTPLIGSITKWLAVKARIASPWFQVYPDLGNLSAWGVDVADELAKGIDHIVAVHVKDMIAPRQGFAGQFKGVPFGSGCVDFVAAFAELKRLGCESAPRHDPTYTNQFSALARQSASGPHAEFQVRQLANFPLAARSLRYGHPDLGGRGMDR